MSSYYSRSKRFFIYLSVFLLGLAGGVFIERQFFVDKSLIVEPVAVSLTIKSAANEIVDFQNLQVIPGTSVFSLMNKLVEAGKISWELNNQADGRYVSALVDKKNQTGAEEWRCYINSQPCQTSLDRLRLQGQEHLEWKYEK